MLLLFVMLVFCCLTISTELDLKFCLHYTKRYFKIQIILVSSDFT
jgi:hypothetical protein